MWTQLVCRGFLSWTSGRTPWIGDRLIARPIATRKSTATERKKKLIQPTKICMNFSSEEEFTARYLFSPSHPPSFD
jgi:hypothetical protein